MIEIPGGPSIGEDEIVVTASRAGGPGGQHVNKTSTRITLSFDVLGSPSLTDRDRARLAARLGNRISSAGILRVTASRSRSQKQNREAALARFVALLAGAYVDEPRRVATRPTAASRRRRLEGKKKRAGVKRQRTRPDSKGDD